MALENEANNQKLMNEQNVQSEQKSNLAEELEKANSKIINLEKIRVLKIQFQKFLRL